MDAQDQQVLHSLHDWLDRQQEAWLCTITATYGSSPRPPGSLFAFSRLGQRAGSLSGGCVEEALIDELQRTPARRRPLILQYGGDAHANRRLQLPCGGSMEIVAQHLGLHQDLEMLEQILASLKARRCIQRQLHLNTGHSRLQQVADFQPLNRQEELLIQTFGPRYRMLLIGAGPLSACLATMALQFDYRVLVCDPREDFFDSWPLPEVEFFRCLPDEAIRLHARDAHSIVLALSHDPRLDDMGLMEALNGEAFYVGALGSRRSSEERRKRLQALAIPPERIARLHAPVGMAIGSRTPAEIAVAILAELTLLRRRHHGMELQRQAESAIKTA